MEGEEKVCPRCAETIKAAAVVCRFCGNEFGAGSADASASSPATRPVQTARAAPTSAQPAKPTSKVSKVAIVATIAVVVVLIFAVIGSNQRSVPTATDSSTGSLTQEQAAKQPSTPAIPDEEQKFIAAVKAAHDAYDASANDMAKGGTRATRREAICQVIPQGRADSWIGTIKTLSSNGDGKGVLEIELAPDVSVGTWNNAISDIEDNTLLDPKSDVFVTASSMKVGDTIQFSGTFLHSDVDCAKEISLTLEGSMQEPEFLLRFASVSVPTAAAQPQATDQSSQSQPTEQEPPPQQSQESSGAEVSPATVAPASTPTQQQSGDDVSNPETRRATVRTSFDCAQPANTAELLICSDSTLAELDLEMSGLFRSAITAAADPRAIRALHQDWVALERNACRNVSCLRTAYRRHIADLKSMASD